MFKIEIYRIVKNLARISKIKWYYDLMLRLKLKSESKKITLYRDYIRKLNKIPSIKYLSCTYIC